MKVFLRAIYSASLLGAGVLHFFKEKSFRRIIPTILPFRKAAVLITGVFEIIFSSLLWVKKGQHITSKLLAFFMIRSEEHTSELQSRGHPVCRLLLENKHAVTLH